MKGAYIFILCVAAILVLIVVLMLLLDPNEAPPASSDVTAQRCRVGGSCPTKNEFCFVKERDFTSDLLTCDVKDGRHVYRQSTSAEAAAICERFQSQMKKGTEE